MSDTTNYVPPSHSLPNNIRTPPRPHPDLVHAPGVDVDAVAGGKGRLGVAVLVSGVVCDGELAREDEVRGEGGVGVRWVVFCKCQLGLRDGQREGWAAGYVRALGSSVQVKTWEKPQERTSDSGSEGMVVVLRVAWLIRFLGAKGTFVPEVLQEGRLWMR